MKPKLLKLRQQMGIFNTPNPVEVMRKYVSYSKYVLPVAQVRMHTQSLEKFIALYEGEDTPNAIQQQLFQNLSDEDAHDIYFKIHGHIYPEVWMKMLEIFPQHISKDFLLEYSRYCGIRNDVMIKAVSVLGKNARDIISIVSYWEIDVFNQILRVFGKEETKKILLEMANENLDMDREVELKLLRIYSNADLKELLTAFITKCLSLEGEMFVKIFDVCSSKEEVKMLLELAIKNDMDIWNQTLDKIVEYFPPEEAKSLLDAFFEQTSPGSSLYDDYEKEELYASLDKTDCC